ncbi:MAG: DUF6316 family protein [Thiohalophilus sp.]|uniref:DUF6316 family protein n=1 Tax=Thiohalophilus sp. TaxID=3028392 RepID=UPI00286FE581|nr:DUF6316 family protein [Thiohalophilus sp.]MDR9436144.1 DUF6316 family protein [Thiohalophilus sp.]
MQAGEPDSHSTKPERDYNGPHRNRENGLIPPRSRRFYFNGQQWFFHTRERITFGPYATFREVEQALKIYLRRCGIVRYRQEPRPSH